MSADPNAEALKTLSNAPNAKRPHADTPNL